MRFIRWLLNGGAAPGRTRGALRALRDALQDAQLEARADGQLAERLRDTPTAHAYARGKLDGLRTATRLLDFAMCSVEDHDRPTPKKECP